MNLGPCISRRNNVSETDPRLMTGEEIVFRTAKHWIAPLSDSWKAVLLILGAVVLSWLEPDASSGLLGFISRVIELLKLGLFFGGLGWIVYNIVAWRTADYTVTNQRVLGKEGLIRSRETDSLLTSISDVRMKVSAVGKGLKYGDLTLLSASGESGADTFTSVRDVETLKKTILEQKIAAMNAAPMAAAAAMAAATPVAAAPQADAMATLASLGQLRDSGVITPEEFEAKKAELLGRI
jgi:uncharacterized membrane protein YdbT with pleckstrin-like domain